MIKHIKLFETHINYNTYITGNNKILPNVSYCKDNKEIHYNPYDFSNRYLTFVALEDGIFKLTIGNAVPTTILQSISYSIDNGTTWITTNNIDNETVVITTPTINSGNKVLWKGTGVGVSTTTNNNNRPSTSSIFSSTGTFNVEGNILSLVWGDNFINKDYLAEGSSYNFALLFYAQTEHVQEYAKVVSTKNLCLPVKNVTNYCYFRMFQEYYVEGTCQPNNTLVNVPKCINAENMGEHSCQSMFLGCVLLTSIPEKLLPTTSLAPYCYAYMFQSCGLTSIPEKLLSATTLASNCYEGMFFKCISLAIIPEKLLPATTLANSCYYDMFMGCTRLTIIPEKLLPATTLANSCYYGMFTDCFNITTIPEKLLPATTLAPYCYKFIFQQVGCTTVPEKLLPATTLASYCYDRMFWSCSSLTNAPELPATTLVSNCYYGMFTSCTSLVTAPELPATTLVSNCYSGMFYGCTLLNYIKAMFTTTPSTTYTNNWLKNVAATGTFVKNSAAQWDVTGVHGIPSGWTVQTASE